MRALVFVLCSVARADVSVPDGSPRCQAQIDAAARQMVAHGYRTFSSPIINSDFNRIHVTFVGSDAIAYIAILPPSQTVQPGPTWRDHDAAPESWWMSVKRVGAWAAELGIYKGPAPEQRLFFAAFKVAADACRTDVNSGSFLRIPTK